ncbi:Hint domain-containing protein, partial [Streptomyces sp. UG1]|uniref:Hint domain-containing protein n=1 Tax=Streptomyces sp. UG1 TaxID=3417652 RepID=UPI003CF4330F
PANDAIQLGSPYVTTDSAAGLVVLTGQASKTIAEQQKAVADAHAKNAQQEAAAAKALADRAKGDAKAAYQHAAGAARHAASARTYAKQALGYAADAAKAASRASASLARTIEYDRKATQDAAAADKAAGRAEGHAEQARDSADQAALDASAARAAAAQAELAAKDARAAAQRADAAATAAEEAAKDAQKYAREAQKAAESAARKEANKQVATGAGTGVGGTFYVVDDVEVTDAKQDNPCELPPGLGTSCTVTYTFTFNATVSFYACLDPDVPATEAGCPRNDVVFLGTQTFKGLTKKLTRTFTQADILKGLIDTYLKIGKELLVQDFVDCWHGSVSGCAWAASNFVPGKAIGKAVGAIRALDAAMRTGIGVGEAFKALKKLDLDAATLARLEGTVNAYEDLARSCKVNSFLGTTEVLMADGSTRKIKDVGIGDKVLATDPGTGETKAETVTAEIRGTGLKHLVKVTIDIEGGKTASVTATDGHPFWVPELGQWIDATDLAPGERLRTTDGNDVRITKVQRWTTLAATVYNLTVSKVHTYYVVAGNTPVLVHNSGPGCDLFPNTMPGALDRELALADRLGVTPVGAGSAGFDAAISSGTVKWAVREDGSLVIVPKFVNGQEISHSVLTRGAPVRAAGEADIAGSSRDGYFGLDINNHSGHFLPSSESLEIGRDAFVAAGVHF